MKFKRLLAAILSALMITSCIGFVAGAEETETNGVIKEFVFAKRQDLNPGVQNSKSVTKLYDAVSNIAYARVTPNTGNVSVYVNHGGASVTFTEEQAKADTNYLVYYARTNLDNDAETDGVQMPAPSAMLYNATWNTKPNDYNDALTQVTEGFASTITDEWQKFCFKITSKFTKDETEYLLTKWDQVAFGPVGLRAVMDGDKMYSLSDNPYYDIAGYAVVDSLEAAEAYDFATEASVSGVNFDLNYEGAPELTSAPAENPTREGINFKGWATSPDGDIIATDLTTIPEIPAADTTYYAIWESASITFNRRNGAKDAAVSSLNVALGEVIPFPENPTYQNHTFLGWSTEKNNKDKIVDTATAVVTDEMVENGMTYYAVWESTYDSTQPVFFVTAQHNAETMVNENCVGEIRYDAENDIVYKHFSPNTSKLIAGSCNMYGLGNKSFTTDADKLYMVYYIRTNILGSKPHVGIYSTTNKDGTTSSAFKQTPNFTYTEELQDKWTKVIIELAGMSELGICTHIDFSAVGQNKTVTEANYYDISAIAIFDNEEAANNFDIVEASKIGNVTLSFDTHGGSAVADIAVKNGTYIQGTVEVPAPTKADYTFKGWSTELHGTVLASVTNPTADTTYYAVWEMADPEEVSDKLYLSTNGCDVCNNGFSAKYPVKTLKKAQEILNANSSVNTIVVVDTYKKSDESSASVDNFAKGINRKLYITGLASDSVFDMQYFNASNAKIDSHFRIGTDVEFKNITIIGSAKDGGLMSMGYELTFGENVVINGGQNVGILHYNAQLKDNAVVNLLSGTYNKIDLAVQSGQTYRGTSTINIGGTAKTKITNGHGWKGEQSVYGINNVNINGGEVTSIQLTSTADSAVTNYAGLRYFTINGGTVGDIYTTGSSVSKKFDNTYLTTSARAGVTVIEINDGTVGAIKIGTNRQTGEADPDDATRIVIFNNGMTATVSDPGAVVIKSTGGTIKAVTNAYDADGNPTYGTYDKATADWGKAVKLTGYSYTTDSANKYININGTNYDLATFTDVDATLAEEVTVLIPAELFEAGKENAAIFSETPLYEIKWVDGEETVKTEGVAKDALPTAPELTKVGYTLSWTPEVIAASADATYTAVWTLNNYTITFDAGEGAFTDGEKTKTVTADHGATPEFTEIPVLAGYTFASWEPEVDAATATATYTAKWTANKHNVIYMVDGEEYNKTEYAYGAEVAILEAPEAREGYTFSGWSVTEAFTMPDADVTITGTFTVNNHNVIYTVDGAEYDKTEYAYGAEVAILEAPEAREGYTFSGWSVTEAFTMPDEDVTITGTWIINNYTITFDAGEGAFTDGEKIKTVTADHGATPEFTEVPVLEGYTFAGWEPEVDAATATATYTAKWTANNYTITYYVNSEEVKKDTYAYGADVTAYEYTASTGYTFSGWDKEIPATMPAENLEISGTTTVNKYTVTYYVDGEVYKTVENVAYGTAVELIPAPEKAGYTFSGWDKEAFTMPDSNVTINGTFTKNEEPKPTTPTYKTYGKYNATNNSYTVELKFVGAKVNQGSFGFEFPEDCMTFKSVEANVEAGIEFLPETGTNASKIFAKGENYYANTWAVTSMEFGGNIDATNEEVLIATFNFDMTAEERAAFEQELAKENYKFEEYVVTNADAKYHNGTNYLATPYSTGFDTTKAPITYASHADEETTAKVEYFTYGKYDAYNGTYEIDIKIKGAKINFGAFGLAFNPEYMTFDPAADENGNAENVKLADGIANFLDIVLENSANGYAFAFDGSSQENGYIDARDEEVLLATISLTMTKEQRAAFENAGKTMAIYVPTANTNIDAETLAKYFDGESYIANLYTNGLEIPKIKAEYVKHTDEVLPVTVADVEVEVTFASKVGSTVTNIATIKLGDGEATALEEAGNDEKTIAYAFKALTIGEKYTVRVEKNGYLAGVCEFTVKEGENKVEMTLLAGDIKGTTEANCGDGVINLDDFVRLIRAFDENANNTFRATVDLDESGFVNVTDLSILKANYNKTTADNAVSFN